MFIFAHAASAINLTLALCTHINFPLNRFDFLQLWHSLHSRAWPVDMIYARIHISEIGIVRTPVPPFRSISIFWHVVDVMAHSRTTHRNRDWKYAVISLLLTQFNLSSIISINFIIKILHHYGHCLFFSLSCKWKWKAHMSHRLLCGASGHHCGTMQLCTDSQLIS